MPPFFIVQNTKSNMDRFGTVIFNSMNIVELPLESHRSATGYFSSVQDFSMGMTVRQWVAESPYELQYEFGMSVLKNYGVRENLALKVRLFIPRLVSRLNGLLGR